MRIARYEKRLFAYLFDCLLALGGALAIFFFIPMDLMLAMRLVYSQLLAAAIYAFINTVTLWITNGYTIGSAIIRIRAVTIDDKRLSLRIALVRSAGLAIFPWALVNAINMLIVHTERTIFDRLSDTLVIDKKCY